MRRINPLLFSVWVNIMSTINGISKATFAIGLASVLCIAIFVAYSFSVSIPGPQGIQGIQGVKGDKGDQGDQGLKGDQGIQGVQGLKGDQGIQGIQGIQGPAGNVAVYVSAGLVDYYSWIWLGADHHNVQGYIINFGSTTANNVQIKMTWNLGGGAYVYKTYYAGAMAGHQITKLDITYDFDNQGSFSYTVDWT